MTWILLFLVTKTPNGKVFELAYHAGRNEVRFDVMALNNAEIALTTRAQPVEPMYVVRN